MVKPSWDFESSDMERHWSPKSEKYAGGDALTAMLKAGWRIRSIVSQSQRGLSDIRRITIYHLELERDGRTVNMSVLSNPYVNGLLASLYSIRSTSGGALHAVDV